MRIALAQLSAGPDRSANLARTLDTMTAARQAGADLIAFPEVILDRFFPQVPGDRDALQLAEPVPGPTSDAVAARARELGLVTVFNLYELAGEHRFDSSPVFDADGTLLGITRMIHITDYEGFHEQDYYHPGDKGMPVYERGWGGWGWRSATTGTIPRSCAPWAWPAPSSW